MHPSFLVEVGRSYHCLYGLKRRHDSLELFGGLAHMHADGDGIFF